MRTDTTARRGNLGPMARSERRLGAQYQTEISDSDDRDMERCAWSNELNGRLYRWLPFPMEIPATCDKQINRGEESFYKFLLPFHQRSK